MDHLSEGEVTSNMQLKHCLVNLIMTALHMPIEEGGHYVSGGLSDIVLQCLCFSRDRIFIGYIFAVMMGMMDNKERLYVFNSKKSMNSLENIVEQVYTSDSDINARPETYQNNFYPDGFYVKILLYLHFCITSFNAFRDRVFGKKLSPMETKINILRTQLWLTLPPCYPILSTDAGIQPKFVIHTKRLNLKSIPISFDQVMDFKLKLMEINNVIQDMLKTANFEGHKLLNFVALDYVEIDQMLSELMHDILASKICEFVAGSVKNTHLTIRDTAEFLAKKKKLTESKPVNRWKAMPKKVLEKQDEFEQFEDNSLEKMKSLIDCQLTMIEKLYLVASDYYGIKKGR